MPLVGGTLRATTDVATEALMKGEANRQLNIIDWLVASRVVSIWETCSSWVVALRLGQPAAVRRGTSIVSSSPRGPRISRRIWWCRWCVSNGS
jgi:hypothetical protein